MVQTRNYRILVTGFGSYGNTTINPSLEIVKLLQQRQPTTKTNQTQHHGNEEEDEEKKQDEAVMADNTEENADNFMPFNVEVFAKQVSNEFYTCIEQTKTYMNELQPLDAVLILGEYPGRSMVTLERFATNYNDYTRYGWVDEAGVALQGQPTIPQGPVAYQSTIPLRRCVQNLRQEGIPSDISGEANSHMCNHLLYGILHHVDNQTKLWYPSYHAPLVGMVHLPMLPETAALECNLGMPSMTRELSFKAVTTILHSVIEGVEEHQEGTMDIDIPIKSRLLV